MYKLTTLALVAGLAPAALAAPGPLAVYRVSEDTNLRYAQVISSRPAYRQVRVTETYQLCGRAVPMGGVSPSHLGLPDASAQAPPHAQCRLVSSYRYEQRVEGYDVTYHYQGRIYTTRMPYDPGSRVPVRLDVPVRY